MVRLSLDWCWLPVCFAFVWSVHEEVVGAEARRDRCVILVSVDGLANFYLDDPKSDMPTLQRLIKEGVRADGMVCVFPTVTWPNHTTLVTGVSPAKHGVLGNAILDRKRGEKLALIMDPLFDKDEVIRSPTIYDAAAQAGLKTAAIVWPCTRNARTLDFTVPDMAAEGYEKYSTPAWVSQLKSEGIPVDRYGHWQKESSGGVPRDWLACRMVRQLLEKHQPNLILVHLIEVDHVEHRWGPQTADAYWATGHADRCLRDLVDAIEASPMRDKTTLLVCSDHGFFPISKEIRPNVVLRKRGLIEVADNKATKKLAWCLAEGGAAAIHILEDANRDATIETLKTELAAIEGVDRVYAPSEFAEIGQPTSNQSPHGADLWLSAKKGYSFSDTFTGEDVVAAGRPTYLGTHGYNPKQPDLYATFVAWGAGVPKGKTVGRVNNTDVAPTIARLLAIPFPSAEGTAIDSIGVDP